MPFANLLPSIATIALAESLRKLSISGTTLAPQGVICILILFHPPQRRELEEKRQEIIREREREAQRIAQELQQHKEVEKQREVSFSFLSSMACSTFLCCPTVLPLQWKCIRNLLQAIQDHWILDILILTDIIVDRKAELELVLLLPQAFQIARAD